MVLWNCKITRLVVNTSREKELYWYLSVGCLAAGVFMSVGKYENLSTVLAHDKASLSLKWNIRFPVVISYQLSFKLRFNDEISQKIYEMHILGVHFILFYSISLIIFLTFITHKLLGDATNI